MLSWRCKLLLSDSYQLNYNQAKFLPKLNCKQKSLVFKAPVLLHRHRDNHTYDCFSAGKIYARVGNYATAWMDSWRVTQQILCDFRNRFLTKNTRAQRMSSYKHNLQLTVRETIYISQHCIVYEDTWYAITRLLRHVWEGQHAFLHYCILFVSICFLLCSSNSQLW